MATFAKKIEEKSASSPDRKNEIPRGINRLVRHGFPPSFFVLLAPVTYLMIHKKSVKKESVLVSVFVGDTAHLRVSGKSVCHFLQDFLTGGSGTGFEKEWIFLKKGFFAL